MVLDLERYYTRATFARMLVSKIPSPSPIRVLDLGVGQGALLREAVRRWPDAEYWAADVDEDAFCAIKSTYQGVKFVPSNILIDGLPEAVTDKLDGKFDVAICNPPYTPRVHGSRLLELLHEIGLDRRHIAHLSTGPAIFLALLLNYLRPNGELGVILPDGVMCGAHFRPMRDLLLSQHGVRAIIELPTYAFSNTEAKTHILFLQKNGTTNYSVPLYQADRSGHIVNTVKVDKSALNERMDYSWHHWRAKNDGNILGTNLEELGVTVYRSGNGAKALREAGIFHVHTTSLPKEPGELYLAGGESPGLIARAGDILLGRVGSRCLGRSAIVYAGTAPVSDCVYVIRPPDHIRRAVWDALSSERGMAWIQANARGVCARYITRTDLLRFPLFDP